MTAIGMARTKAHEGLRLDPYRDIAGNLTIGYGRNLDANGIRQTEADLMFVNDWDEAQTELGKYEWFTDLDPVRQDALTDLMLNLGAAKFAGFHYMIAALAVADYDKAADELLDSDAARELPKRHRPNAAALRTGSWA